MIAADPVILGLVKSLEKPGSNITGLYQELPDFPSRRIALFKEMVPQAKTIGIPWDAHLRNWKRKGHGSAVSDDHSRATRKSGILEREKKHIGLLAFRPTSESTP
jgi:hypothetical protein